MQMVATSSTFWTFHSRSNYHVSGRCYTVVRRCDVATLPSLKLSGECYVARGQGRASKVVTARKEGTVWKQGSLEGRRGLGGRHGLEERHACPPPLPAPPPTLSPPPRTLPFPSLSSSFFFNHLNPSKQQVPETLPPPYVAITNAVSSQPASQPTNQPASRPANQPANQPANRPASQPVSPPNPPSPVL